MTWRRPPFKERVLSVLENGYDGEGWLARLTALTVLGGMAIAPLLMVIALSLLAGAVAGLITNLLR